MISRNEFHDPPPASTYSQLAPIRTVSIGSSDNASGRMRNRDALKYHS